MTTPAKCQNCGYSTRYSRQEPGEVPLFVRCCSGYLCAGCRKHRNCVRPSEPTPEAKARIDLQQSVPVNDGWYSRIPDTVYHADRASLSSSGARRLMPPSAPAIFKAAQDEPPKPKPHYDFGHAAHKMVLGEGSDLFVLDPVIHGRTKEGKVAQNPAATSMWKAADQKARQMGKSCITKEQMGIAQIMAGRVFAHPIAAKLLDIDNGVAEYSGYWHDDETSVRLRLRPDWVYTPQRGRAIYVEYKSAISAEPKEFEKSVGTFGYHCQAAWQLDGLAEVEVSDDAAHLFIVQQKTPPFLVSVVQLDPEAIELGRRQNRRAIDIYAECSDRNQWPGYGTGIYTASLPGWLVKQVEQQLEIV